MGRVDDLLRRYEAQASLPWIGGLSGAERVWFAVYDPPDERRLRARLEAFEVATRTAGHGWVQIDISDAFETWLAAQPYRERYFSRPELLDMALEDFEHVVAAQIREAFPAPEKPDETVFALVGVGALFGLTRVSRVVQLVEREVRGRLLVFFPGSYRAGIYRLLDARDGWNYRAVPITAGDGD